MLLNNVTNIAGNAFWKCTSLGNITIGSGVTSIGNAAFEECSSLASVRIPTSVTSIGDDAFALCALSNVSIPNSVTSLGGGAFFYCWRMTDVAIGTGVTSIGDAPFDMCVSLTAIAVDPLNSSYSSVAGVLFDKNQTTLIQYPESKAGGGYTIPTSVTRISGYAFDQCTNLTSVTIPNSVTNIGLRAFCGCKSLTSVAVGSGVTGIGDVAFGGCTSLTNVTIGTGVTSIGDTAFGSCTALRGVYFLGNAPRLVGPDVFNSDNNATVYHLAGTTGWGATFGGRPTAVWLPPPSPRAQTAEVESGAEFRATVGTGLVRCQWYFNGTTRLTCTNSVLQLTGVQYSQAGSYTVIVTNAAGSVTSPPALLSVIAPVERRVVPGLILMGQLGTTLNLDFTAALGPAPLWTTFDHVPLTMASQWYFDLTTPLPPQGFYRAWQSGGGAPPALDLHFVPAITLTGAIGSSQRVDYINQVGPIDAWVTLATVTQTNASQLYFDTSVIGQPPRLYRIVPLP